MPMIKAVVSFKITVFQKNLIKGGKKFLNWGLRIIELYRVIGIKKIGKTSTETTNMNVYFTTCIFPFIWRIKCHSQFATKRLR